MRTPPGARRRVRRAAVGGPASLPQPSNRQHSAGGFDRSIGECAIVCAMVRNACKRPFLRNPRYKRPSAQNAPPAQIARGAGVSSSGAAQESNLPSLGLPDLTGFEDRLGHRARAAPPRRLAPAGRRSRAQVGRSAVTAQSHGPTSRTSVKRSRKRPRRARPFRSSPAPTASCRRLRRHGAVRARPDAGVRHRARGSVGNSGRCVGGHWSRSGRSPLEM